MTEWRRERFNRDQRRMNGGPAYLAMNLSNLCVLTLGDGNITESSWMPNDNGRTWRCTDSTLELTRCKIGSCMYRVAITCSTIAVTVMATAEQMTDPTDVTKQDIQDSRVMDQNLESFSCL